MPNVDSKAISRVEYDADTRVLSIWFHTGKRYDCPGVPRGVYEQMMSASSIGGFFNEYIRGKYT